MNPDVMSYNCCYPQNGWFYIGAQHWTVVDFERIWPLEGKVRGSFIGLGNDVDLDPR